MPPLLEPRRLLASTYMGGVGEILYYINIKNTNDIYDGIPYHYSTRMRIPACINASFDLFNSNL